MAKTFWVTAGLAVLALLVTPPLAHSAEIAGKVVDKQNNPVPLARVMVEKKAGKILGQASADSHGDYTISGISTGTYHLKVVPGGAFKGNIVEAAVPPTGLCVNWKVSPKVAALATARPGALPTGCTPVAADPPHLSTGEKVGLGVLGAGGVGVGVAAAAGAFNGHSHVTSGSR